MDLSLIPDGLVSAWVGVLIINPMVAETRAIESRNFFPRRSAAFSLTQRDKLAIHISVNGCPKSISY